MDYAVNLALKEPAMRHASLSPALLVAALLGALGAAGCYQAVDETLSSSGAAAGSQSSAGSSGSRGSGSGTVGSNGATGSTGGSGITGTGATGSSSASAGTTTGSPADQTCTAIEATLATLGPELLACGIPLPITLTLAQCEAQIGTCSAADLAAINTFVSCVNAVPAVSCSPASLLPLAACQGGIANVTCVNFTGGTGGGTATSGGFGTGGLGGATGGLGGFFGDGGLGGFGDAGFGTGGGLGGGFCSPCMRNHQCGRGNACINDGQGNPVCGQDCSQNQSCPAGSSCQMTTDQFGKPTTQCVPQSCP